MCAASSSASTAPSEGTSLVAAAPASAMSSTAGSVIRFGTQRLRSPVGIERASTDSSKSEAAADEDDALSASRWCRVLSELGAFLESIFQDPCPTLNGTRRVTMPQVLTRRSEPIHPSSQARSPAPTNPKTGSGSDHPGGRSPQSHCSISPSVLSLSHTARSHCSASVLRKGVLSWDQPLL